VLTGQIESGVANAVSGLIKTYLAVDEKAELDDLAAEVERLRTELRRQGRLVA
jgi:hypothetical protein